MVDREADHLDAGKARFHLDEQRRVGAIEPVHRLSRVADEEQVVAAGAQQVDDAVLHRVEVLSLVDQQMSEPPPQPVREVGVALGFCEHVEQHVIEVDHAPSAFVPDVALEDARDGVDAGCGPTAHPTCGRWVSIGSDAACHRPGDLVVGGVHHLPATGESIVLLGIAEQTSAVARHRLAAAVGVGPALTEHPQHHRVERPGLDVVAEPESQQSATQLASGFSRERESERVVGVGLAPCDAMSDPPCQDPGLARPGARDDSDQLGRRGDGGALVGIQIGDQRIGVHVGIVGRSTVRPCRTRRGC